MRDLKMYLFVVGGSQNKERREAANVTEGSLENPPSSQESMAQKPRK